MVSDGKVKIGNIGRYFSLSGRRWILSVISTGKDSLSLYKCSI